MSGLVVIPGGFPKANLRIQKLTEREREVLQATAFGRTGPDIADRLGISYATVRTHRQNILVKLGVHTMTRAVVIAKDAGVIG